jgi:glutamine amidotransferase
MLAIIDYDMGNLKSVAKALQAVGADVRVTRDPKIIADADKVVLPGVGAFTECMANLEKYALIDPVKKSIAAGKPFLGICLGLQLLFEESEEFGPTPGLGILKGKVKKFVFDPVKNPQQQDLKIPHMGWNQTHKNGDPVLFRGIPQSSDFYFVHSYYAAPADAAVIATTTDYGFSFCSSIQKDNLFACQFHPEKSQTKGLQVLKNFLAVKN